MGGPAGDISFADYLEAFHKATIGSTSGTVPSFIGTDLLSLMESDTVNNPYALLNAYDPYSEIVYMNNYAKTYHSSVVGDTTKDKWEEYFDSCLQKFDSTIDKEYIDDLVEEFEITSREKHLREVSRFSSMMGDAGASDTSSFVVGMALFGIDRARQIDNYRKELLTKYEQQRIEFATNVANSMMDMFFKHTALKAEAYNMVIQTRKLGAVLMHEQATQNAQFTKMEADWPYEVFRRSGSYLGSLGSGTYIPDTTHQLISSGLSAAASIIGG